MNRNLDSFRHMHFAALVGASPLLSAAVFTAALALFEALTMHRGYVHYLSTGRTVHGAVAALAFVLLGQAVTLLFVWSSFLARRRLRPVFWATFAAVVLIQYGYYDALRGFVTPDDLIAATWGANVELRWGMAASYLGTRAIVPAAAYALALWAAPAQGHSIGAVVRPLLTLVALVSGLSVVRLAPALEDFRWYPTTSIGAFYQTGTDIAWTWRQHVRTPLPLPPLTVSPRNNIVFIVDESVRADYLSVNGYGRATTPTLDALDRQGLLTNWGVAVSGSNCSLASNQLLWMGLAPARLPARDGEADTWPDIMQYAKAMGYRTFVIDGQLTHHWIGNPFELQDIDEWIPYGTSVDAADTDFAIADRVRRIVDGSLGNFIWINKRGVHWPYPSAYPPEAAMWTPAAARGIRIWGRPDRLPRPLLVNAYANAIRYNVDGFFQRLDVTTRRPGTVFLYTSDHGQSLADHGEPWLHCSDRRGGPGPRHAEVMVPLLMTISGESGRDVGPAKDRASHANVFTTLLDLMEVPESLRRSGYWPSLWPPERFRFKPRSYFLSNAIKGTTPFWDLVPFDE